MVDPNSINILTGTGIVIGGIITGIVANRNLPLFRKKYNGNGQCKIALSEQTGGVKHISEEALIKITEIKKFYLTKDKHDDVCGRKESDIKLYISQQIGTSTETILKAIKDNGK